MANSAVTVVSTGEGKSGQMLCDDDDDDMLRRPCTHRRLGRCNPAKPNVMVMKLHRIRMTRMVLLRSGPNEDVVPEVAPAMFSGNAMT